MFENLQYHSRTFSIRTELTPQVRKSRTASGSLFGPCTVTVYDERTKDVVEMQEVKNGDEAQSVFLQLKDKYIKDYQHILESSQKDHAKTIEAHGESLRYGADGE